MKVQVVFPSLVFLFACSFTFSQTIDQDGEALFSTRCASCHLNPDPINDAHTPSREGMSRFTPNSVYSALTSGAMQIQATGLSDEQKRLLASTITGSVVADVALEISSGLCHSNDIMGDALTPYWSGWGPDTHNTRYAGSAGITAETLPHLRLKWAYGLPGEGQPRAQPAVIGDRLFVGNRAGALYSLDAASGCTYWSFLPRSGIRSALSVDEYVFKNEDESEANEVSEEKGYAIYFVDTQANAYAVNAQTGEQLWVTQVDDHPAVRGTGSLTLHDGVLYVPMTGVSEENAASGADYSCCTFRGSVTAIDAHSGELLWRYFTVPEPQLRGHNANGVALYGPAGVGIWSAPTIDEKRGLVYVATGNAYTEPAAQTSDAVIALDLETGEQVWVNQLLPGDAWIGGCRPDEDNENCPENLGPDFDFSASPILSQTSDGRDLLVIPQKSGVSFALDPDQQGELVWEYRFGTGSSVGGVWGMAVAEGRAYAAVGGYFSPESGGIHAIDIDSGERLWASPAIATEDLFCEAGAGCGPTQSAAVTAIPGAVFSGSQDGGMRAYSAQDGEILWSFDANQQFETINGVDANGASFDGSGPVIANGMLYMLSGNAGFVGRPGNVLLAFEVDEDD